MPTTYLPTSAFFEGGRTPAQWRTVVGGVTTAITDGKEALPVVLASIRNADGDYSYMDRDIYANPTTLRARGFGLPSGPISAGQYVLVLRGRAEGRDCRPLITLANPNDLNGQGVGSGSGPLLVSASAYNEARYPLPASGVYSPSSLEVRLYIPTNRDSAAGGGANFVYIDQVRIESVDAVQPPPPTPSLFVTPSFVRLPSRTVTVL